MIGLIEGVDYFFRIILINKLGNGEFFEIEVIIKFKSFFGK